MTTHPFDCEINGHVTPQRRCSVVHGHQMCLCVDVLAIKSLRYQASHGPQGRHDAANYTTITKTRQPLIATIQIVSHICHRQGWNGTRCHIWHDIMNKSENIISLWGNALWRKKWYCGEEGGGGAVAHSDKNLVLLKLFKKRVGTPWDYKRLMDLLTQSKKSNVLARKVWILLPIDTEPCRRKMKSTYWRNLM
jgi:hypothetical protein